MKISKKTQQVIVIVVGIITIVGMSGALFITP